MNPVQRNLGLAVLVGSTFVAIPSTSLARVQTRVDDVHAVQPPPGAPAAPDGCQAQLMNVFGTWQAGIGWNDRSNNEDGFILEWRLTLGGLLNQSGTTSLGANTTSTIAFAGYSGTHAKYRVRAVNSSGNSHWSNWASLIVP